MIHLNQKRNLLASASLLLIVLIVVFVIMSDKQKVYLAVGNMLFGESVGPFTIYQPTLAEYFLLQSNETGSQPLKWANYQLARLAFVRGDYTRAIHYSNEELRLYPSNCRTHYIRGLVYGYMDKLDLAIDDFEIFNTSCVRDSWAGHNDLAWFYFRKGDLQKALAIVELVIYKDTNSLNPWLQNTYGTILLNLGRHDEARDALLKARYLADNLTEEEWGKSYPGNDPRIYGEGLNSMRKIIEKNLLLLEKKQ